MNQAPERFKWARELMNIQPGDHILEIGCGAGLLAELIAEQLPTGRIVAIDRSAAMIEKANKRNQKYIAQGISTFMNCDLLEYNLSTAPFDRIVAFNVNFFLKNTINEFKHLKQLLKKNGKLYVFYQAPSGNDTSSINTIKENLMTNKFSIINTEIKSLFPAPAFCLIAKTRSER